MNRSKFNKFMVSWLLMFGICMGVIAAFTGIIFAGLWIGDKLGFVPTVLFGIVCVVSTAFALDQYDK